MISNNVSIMSSMVGCWWLGDWVTGWVGWLCPSCSLFSLLLCHCLSLPLLHHTAVHCTPLSLPFSLKFSASLCLPTLLPACTSVLCCLHRLHLLHLHPHACLSHMPCVSHAPAACTLFCLPLHCLHMLPAFLSSLPCPLPFHCYTTPACTQHTCYHHATTACTAHFHLLFCLPASCYHRLLSPACLLCLCMPLTCHATSQLFPLLHAPPTNEIARHKRIMAAYRVNNDIFTKIFGENSGVVWRERRERREKPRAA